jgi:hypothetical protein
MAVEYSVLPLRPRSTFAGLAASRGFSERDCELAARSGLLAGIIACPVIEHRSGRLSGAVALARLQELKAKLQEAQLRAAGLI